MTIGGVFAGAWALYRLLFRRSIVVALIVFSAIYGAEEVAHGSHHTVLLGLVAFVFHISGPLLIQGALIELVQDVHVGNRPPSVRELFARTRPRILTLLGGSLLYGLFVVVGLVLLILPGLYFLARFSLIIPAIVLENRTVSSALDRSWELVLGRTGRVLCVVLLSTAIESSPGFVPYEVPGGETVSTLLGAGLTVLLAPFLAHILSALYYGLADPERPLVHPSLAGKPMWAPAPVNRE